MLLSLSSSFSLFGGGLPSPFHSLCVNNVLSTFFFPPLLGLVGWAHTQSSSEDVSGKRNQGSPLPLFSDHKPSPPLRLLRTHEERAGGNLFFATSSKEDGGGEGLFFEIEVPPPHTLSSPTSQGPILSPKAFTHFAETQEKEMAPSLLYYLTQPCVRMKEAFFAPNIMRDIFGLLINHSWYVSRAPLASIVGLKKQRRRRQHPREKG